MGTIKDINEYPILIQASNIHRYIRRFCPCIVYFMFKAEFSNYSVIRNIETTCKKYPQVFCYRVGWDSFQKHFPNAQSFDINDVTVWRANAKIMSYKNPTEEQIIMMFNYVQARILSEDNAAYNLIVIDMVVKKTRMQKSRFTRLKEKFKKAGESFPLFLKSNYGDFLMDSFIPIESPNCTTFRSHSRQNPYPVNKNNILHLKNKIDDKKVAKENDMKKMKNISDNDQCIAESLLLLRYGQDPNTLQRRESVIKFVKSEKNSPLIPAKHEEIQNMRAASQNFSLKERCVSPVAPFIYNPKPPEESFINTKDDLILNKKPRYHSEISNTSELNQEINSIKPNKIKFLNSEKQN